MQIDWFTVVAQIANFLILLYLLRRFLFKPVVRVMDERQEQIAARFEDAEQQKQEAESEARQLRENRRELEKEREKLLSEARQEAEQRKQQLLEEAKRDVAERHQHWQKSLQKEHQDFLHELRQDLGEQAVQIARQALKELADKDLEEKIIDRFFYRLDNLDGRQKEELRKTIERMEGRVIVRSAFVLPGEKRSQLIELLQEKSGQEEPIHIHFDRSPELISGIELYASGQKLGWSFDQYLDQLEERIRDLIEEKTRTEEERLEAEIEEGLRGEA